jgi:enoyl-CoA hydratase/carnithine racemase
MSETTTENAGPVLYAVDDGVALITLNRPDRLNAWNAELGTAYHDYLDQAEADPDVRVIVVTGAGRGWCAGADMDLLQGLGGSVSGDRNGEPDTRDTRRHLEIKKPIIAAINGACAGLGFVYAIAADLRFAAEGAKFTTAFSQRGLIAEYGSSWYLPRLVGQSVALDLLMSGRVFLAEEAKELGVVNKVFPPEDLLAETMAYAKQMAASASPTSMAIMKDQIYRHPSMSVDDAVAESIDMMNASLRRPDFKEGVASFVEKRPPRFEPFTG